jgi:sec-independent protein translocase protein TatA
VGSSFRCSDKGAHVPSIGFSELIVILMILLLVFGASRLPQLGESLGRTVRSFKRGMARDDKIEIGAGQTPAEPAPRKPAPTDITDAEVVEKHDKPT